jgi:hypothetical protein
VNRSACLVVTALVAASVGCGGRRPPPENPAVERKPAAVPTSSRAELGRAVRALPRPGDFFAGVPPSVRQDAEGLVARLAPEDRARLVEPQGRAARQRPLSHLLAGGKSVDALFALATGQAASEVLWARRAAGHADLGEAVVGARALSRNAALAWMEERWIELGTPSTFTAELGDQMAAVAAALQRPDLALLGARAAAEASPSQERWLRLSEAASRALDLGRAEQALGRATRARAEPSVDAARLSSARERVEAARTVLRARGRELGPEEAVSVARAWARLDRARDALASLESHRALREKRLSLAVAWAVARLDGSLCDGLPPATPPELCAVAWQESPAPAEIKEPLDRAWRSHAGRDAASVETYLGLGHVVPWIFSLLRSPSGAADTQTQFGARLGSLASAVGEAAREFPSFEGLMLFVDTMQAGYRAAAAREERVMLSPAVADELWRRASELGSRDGGRPASQGAVLGVAAMLMQDRDPWPLVERLSQPVAPGYARVRATLGLWSAVARRRTDLAEAARAELVGSLPPEGDVGRSQTVLLLAEADALLRGHAEDYVVLGRVADQLLGDGVPIGLRLEAAIDKAGSLARRAEYGAAASALERSLAGTMQAKADRDLVAVARAYLALLRARSARGRERAGRLTEFEQAARPDSGSLPAGARSWHELWRIELMREPKGQRQRAVPSDSERSRSMGAEAARVLAAGALPLGAVESNLSYSLEGGLRPMLNIEMRLLAADMPPTQ